MAGHWSDIEGYPAPLGVDYAADSHSYNFALYSKHATGVTLLLFSAADFTAARFEKKLEPLINKSGRVWHCRVPEEWILAAPYYGYRVDGPRDPLAGHRFDPDKILLDPFARAVIFPPAFSRAAARLPGANPGHAPLGIITPGTMDYDWGDDKPPRHDHDLVIYEMHIRGFTRHPSSGVPPDRRGTFAGVVDKIPYLRDLGVTAVELLPVFQFDPQEGNYWGYMPLSFFALHHDYGQQSARGEQLDEFRDMVKALHKANIEVILDVVYNHTTEGDETGPTYNFRALDNTTYYLLDEDRRRYRNESGTGNVVHTANRHVQAMVLASLRYWACDMRVDGFRFDLASLFTRGDDGSVNLADPPIIAAIQSDPVLAHTRLIAEAWDLSSYQLGRTFPGISWLQWNGQFRDQVRAAIRGDVDCTGNLIQRLYGSDDLFPDTLENAYHAYQSVNFITCHDGFCLYDLLSYSQKNNWPNGHNNTDGSDNNTSDNCGWEGDADLPQHVLAFRRRQAKNFLCLLLLANGTPMLTAGDEFLNTQGGNNNPYNQDNAITWLHWDRLETEKDVFRFCKSMIAFRARHPSLGRSRFWRNDVHWFGPDGPVDYHRRAACFAYHLKGQSEGDQDLYVMINLDVDDITFTIFANGDWHLAIDTSRAAPGDIVDTDQPSSWKEAAYPVLGRSIVVLTSS